MSSSVLGQTTATVSPFEPTMSSALERRNWLSRDSIKSLMTASNNNDLSATLRLLDYYHVFDGDSKVIQTLTKKAAALGHIDSKLDLAYSELTELDAKLHEATNMLRSLETQIAGTADPDQRTRMDGLKHRLHTLSCNDGAFVESITTNTIDWRVRN